jgi:large subunit ribosomal protein L20
MPRVKNNVARLRRKRQILADAKGYFGRRKNLYKTAKEAVERARRYAYRDRKNRKREFRRLWIVRINAAARTHGLSYSRFMDGLKRPGSRSTARCSPTWPCASRRPSSSSPPPPARNLDGPTAELISRHRRHGSGAGGHVPPAPLRRMRVPRDGRENPLGRG